MHIVCLILVAVVICQNISKMVTGVPEGYDASLSNVLVASGLGILFAISLYNDIKNKKSEDNKNE